MHCFCLDKFKENPLDSKNIKFNDINESDKNQYCYDWFVNYSWQNLLLFVTSLMLVLINFFICLIFELISTLEKHHTQNEETLG